MPTIRAEAAEVGTRITSGTISWGVKKSFRTYLASPIAHGEVTTTPPATDNGDVFIFPSASGTWSDSIDVSTQGSVKFSGHEGALDLTLSKPRLVGSLDSAQLKVDAVDSDGTSHSGVIIATVDMSGKVSATGTEVTVSGAPATLTSAGAALFSHVGHELYPEGTELDPVSAKLALETITEPIDPNPTEPTEPTDPTDPGETTPPAHDAKVTGGSFQWGLKQSFRDYLKYAFVAGSTTVIAPATDDGTQTTFTSASGTWDSSRVDVRTRGGVRFTGHHGVMDFTVQNLRLVVDAQRSQLRADVRDSEGNHLSNLAFATIDLDGRIKISDGTVKIAGAPVTLTKAGEAMFDYTGSPMYEAGSVLDPLNGTLNVKGASVPPKSPPTTNPKPKPKVTKKPKADRPRARASRAGELTWGVKSSFRSYITGPIARGSVSVSGGASSAGSAYRFGQSSTTANPPNPAGATSYRGGVQFQGHHGTLDFVISQPTVRVTSANSATLSASVTGRGRLDIATLDLSAAQRSHESGWVRYSAAPARLTGAGVAVFSYQGRGFYQAGSLLDPVTFSVGSGATRGGGNAVVASTTTDDWTPPATPPATTGLTVTQDEVRAGDEIEVSGSGFLPNETGIRVVLYSTPIVLADNVSADGTGKATWKGTIPAAIEPGEHTLTFQGSVDRGVVLQIGKAEQIIGCQLTDGQLYWGFKESFRAYVSGSIAHGDWSTEGHADYATPQFSWAKGEGVRAGDTGAGSLDFSGAILFSGHGGSLRTKIENPVVTFTDTQKAVLSVDYSGTTMEEAMAGGDALEVKQDVPFVDLDLASGIATSTGTSVTISDIPTTLTTAGSTVFPNYEAGTLFDPVTLTFTVDENCSTGAPPQELNSQDSAAATVVTPTAGSSSQPAWLPWVGGALLGALAACAGTVVFMRRRVIGE